ncbi:MAG TPA: DUF3006 domain-containing protein [Clostridiales bacterium]|jgi:hypothetical protein|nr:DUF3006 domain-containing protein [Clostridiales bacterium]
MYGCPLTGKEEQSKRPHKNIVCHIFVKGEVIMRAVIDRLENGQAVVLFGDEEIKVEIPVRLLPEGIKEGDILKVEFTVDKEAEIKQREKVSILLHKLKNKNK